VRRLAPRHDVTGLARHDPRTPHAGRHLVCDLVDARRIAEVVGAVHADAVIHTQALSDVDRCELEPEAAQAQNVEGTVNLLRALERAPSLGRGGRPLLVYVSTDYVFDGMKGAPYEEADEPNPVSVYGRSKHEAERLTLGYPRGVVVRPSTLFGPGRMNFCDHIVSRVSAGAPVEAFTDQVTSPTYTVDLAEGLEELCAALGPADEPPERVVHMANAGGASRVAFARRIATLIGASPELVRPIPMAAQHRPAARPAYSALTTRHCARLIGRILRPWDDALRAYLPTARSGG